MPTDDAGWNDYIELPALPELPDPDGPLDSGAPPAADAPRPAGPAHIDRVPAQTRAGAPGAADGGATPIPPARERAAPSRRVLVIVGAVVAVIVIVVVAIMVTGGGNGTPPPLARGGARSNEEWNRRADAVCTKYHDQIQNAAARGDIDTLTTVGQQELDELRALGMPPRNADVAASMLAFLDQAVNNLRNNDLVAFQGAATSVNAEAAKLGLTACASG